MATVYGNKASSYWKTRMDYTISATETQVKVSFNYGIYGLIGHSNTMSKNTVSHGCTGFSTTTTKMSGGEERISDGEYFKCVVNRNYTINKTTSAKAITFFGQVKHSSSNGIAGTSKASVSYTVPALKSYKVTYYANGGSGAPPAQTKWYGINLTLSSVRPTRSGYAFKGWATSASSSTVSYNPSQSYGTNSALNLYAVWAIDTPPTITANNLYIKSGYKNGDNAIVGLSQITCGVESATWKTGRTATIKLTTNGHTQEVALGDTFEPFEFTPWTVPYLSKFAGTVSITDSSGLSASVPIGELTAVNPTWTASFTVNDPPPPILTDGNAVLTDLQIYNYTTSSWDSTSTKVSPSSSTSSSWTFDFTFDADHVDTTDFDNPVVGLKLEYTHYDTKENEFRKAFFSTTRNQNFSNGIYNTVFVSGVSPKDYPNYTSRVWWSAINDPLYFPDTNYAEVGSNDTMVMGLTKVGSYLGAIKQSKATDTAIYLLYPTSFEEDTTYAVKQGVQGIGAIGKYSFNILGDETLFLSPNGVMSIVPTDDEEHKVQNRSYFIDGKLLKEDNLADAYSFVFDGKYWLGVNDHCYVLDGNQRNSWGNDRTVLVYEGYYLENIPARCFVKFKDRLVFSDSQKVCRFNDSFIDAFNGEEENVPVSAEWSTLLDDDGSVHYYKTMQKKGNVISILPTDYSYDIVEITEDEFNANKKKYYTQDEDGNYVRCTDESVYDSLAVYFIRGRSNTKVFVKKDENEPIEIQRKFSESSQIPSEMMMNKKFKKYKRLQFIIRNDEPEPFGIDEIVKSYTVGNYAKK